MEEQLWRAIYVYTEQFPPKQQVEIMQELLPFVRFPLMDSYESVIVM